MRRSKTELYLHMVWATENRYPFLTDETERRMHRFLQDLAQQRKCVVLALNGIPDHVHLLLSIHATHSAAGLAKDFKGLSSTFANQHLNFPYHFNWQENYGAFTMSRSHIPRVVKYIQRQKEHHATGDVWDEWEETFLELEDVPD